MFFAMTEKESTQSRASPDIHASTESSQPIAGAAEGGAGEGEEGRRLQAYAHNRTAQRRDYHRGHEAR